MLLLRFEFMKMLCFVLFILWIYMLSEVNGERLVKRGLMDNINDGIKYAGQMLGINTAADVANLVAKAFATPAPTKKFDPPSLFQAQDDETTQSYEKKAATKINATEIIGGLLRMIGFDAGKLGALAINAILMIAQLIGNTLSRRQQTRTHLKSSEENETHQGYDVSDPAYNEQEERSGRAHSDEGTPLDWILNNPPEGLKDFLQQITDQKLPERLAEAVSKEEQQDGQGDCIKMLMCKSAPFIWGMQKSVSGRLQGDRGDYEGDGNADPISSLFKNLPDLEEYRNNGHMCERRYSNFCNRSGS